MNLTYFKVNGRTALSVSGGRTSGYMLWLVLQANGGRLPDDCVVLFANTGLEAEETLEFVRDMHLHWGVPIVWLEYRDDEQGFAVVDFDSASRNGEPFEAIIRKRQYLPNPVTRFCTSELKIRTMHKYLRTLGWHEGDDGWDQFIGIRADEPRRIAKIRARGTSTESSKETMCIPLADAGVAVGAVDAFWLLQRFTLRLISVKGRTLEGNCVYCYLKPPAQRLSIAKAGKYPIGWWVKAEGGEWIKAETRAGERFTKDGPSYAQIESYARDQADLFDDDEEALPCFCGD